MTFLSQRRSGPVLPCPTRPETVEIGALVPIEKGHAQVEEEVVAAASRKVPVFGIERLGIRFIRINYNQGVSPVGPHRDPQGDVFPLSNEGIVSMLVTLRKIVQEVSTATHLAGALDIIVHRVKEALPIDACAVYLTDVESHQYVLMASDGFNRESIGDVRIDRQKGLLGLVGERRELITVPGTAAHPRYHPSSATGEERYQSFLGVPLIHYQQVLGVLVAWKRAHDQFDKDEMTFFVTIAAQLAKAIHEAAAVDEVSRMLSGEEQGGAFIQGIQMAAGVATGTATLLDPLAKLESIPDRPAQDIDAEETAFRSAVAAVHEELRASSERLSADLPSEVRALFDVYVMLLGSDSLVPDALARIRAGNWAPGAWRDTIADHAQVFEKMEPPTCARERKTSAR